MKVLVHGEEVVGSGVDLQTRCAHWHSDVDIITIKFKCCGKWYPCLNCHIEIAGHQAKIWPIAERDTLAILCGACGHHLSITEYLQCDSTCPSCKSKFNPGCEKHHRDYFEM